MKPNFPFEAAVFDMDGLLLNTEQLAWDSFHTASRQMNLPDLSHVFYQCVGTAASASKVILKNGLSGIGDHIEFRDRWEVEYRALTHEQAIPIKEGVRELLDALKTMELPVAVATSTETQFALSKLRHSGLFDYFDAVIGGDQVTHSKPAPDIYLKAAQSIDADPARCIAFEDSPNGVRAAVAAGMTVVQVPDLVAPTEELRQLGHIILDSLAHVLDYDFAERK